METRDLQKYPKDKPDMRGIHKRYKTPYKPHSFLKRYVMLDFFTTLYGIQRETISTYFSRAKKSLINYDDCAEFVRNGGKFK